MKMLFGLKCFKCSVANISNIIKHTVNDTKLSFIKWKIIPTFRICDVLNV